MNNFLQQKKTEDHRRTVLSFLSYDTDYRLGNDMLATAFDAHGKAITSDQLHNVLLWLSENGLVTLKEIGQLTFATLTDRGLEVAQGKSRAIGVRDLRPSEIAHIKGK